MKLHHVSMASSSSRANSEPQNVEGWYRFAQSFIDLFKIDRIHSFDIRYSLFDIRYSLFDKLRKAKVSFSIKLVAPGAGDWADT